MIKNQLEDNLKKIIKELGYPVFDPLLYIPKNSSFGDYATNIALQLSKQKSVNSKQSPKEIANEILQKFGSPEYIEKIEIEGPGFINFFIKKEYLAQDLKEILSDGGNFGKSDKGEGQRVQVEFLSANPTGPLTLPNSRGGVLGDSLANVLGLAGFEIEREYYVNDTGNQVRTLGETILALSGKIEPEDKHYKGDYVKDLVDKFSQNLDLDPQKLGHMAADYLLESEIKPVVKKLGINFNHFFSERSLYPDKVEEALELLKKKGFVYQKDGAIWFKSSKLGDEVDRVLVTSDQLRGRVEPTYLLADIAYHLDVFKRGFNRKINIWGADHHGYEKRMKAAVEALGFKDKLDIIFIQMVRLLKDGREVRMSKRAGIYVTIDDLLQEVSSDVVRFFFLMYSPNTHIDFNLDLAKEQSSKNPVFYVQYAHARMNNILIKAGGLKDDAELNLLIHLNEQNLIKHLLMFPSLIEEIAGNYQVHQLTTYAISLADLFHKFYESCPVLSSEEDLKNARLSLVKASQITLANTLALLGVNAPEKM